MPITLYTGENLKKLKKDELVGHIVDLYKFIDLFDGNTKTIKENEELKEENEELKKEVVNIVKIKNKQIEKEKYKYEAMCSEQAESDCAKYIQELQKEKDELIEKMVKKTELNLKLNKENENLNEELELSNMNEKINKCIKVQELKGIIKQKEREEIVDKFNKQYEADKQITLDDGKIISMNELWIQDSEYMNYVHDNVASKRIQDFINK